MSFFFFLFFLLGINFIFLFLLVQSKNLDYYNNPKGEESSSYQRNQFNDWLINKKGKQFKINQQQEENNAINNPFENNHNNKDLISQSIRNQVNERKQDSIRRRFCGNNDNNLFWSKENLQRKRLIKGNKFLAKRYALQVIPFLFSLSIINNLFNYY